MGMFDEITCKYPTPDAEAQGCTFQTKDLLCWMDDYEITEDGRLVRLTWGIEANPDAKPGRLIGCMRRVIDPNRDGDQKYHGVINMYSGRFDYLVKFTDGRVVAIDRGPDWEPTP